MRTFALLAALALTVACGGNASTPAAPTPSAQAAVPPPSQSFDPRASVNAGPFTLTINVTEDGRPLAGVYVNAWVQQSGFGYSYWWAHGPAATDASGRFQFTSLASGSKVYVEASKPGLLQQCASPGIVIGSDTANAVVDAQLVAESKVSASSSSVPPDRPGFHSIFGTLVEIVDGVKRPITGAALDYEPAMDFTGAETRSDAEGRFLLCGIPDNDSVYINAWLGRRYGFAKVTPGMPMPIEIVLPL